MKKNSLTINIILMVTILLISGFSTEYITLGSSENEQSNIIAHGSNEKKYIALTFDDGPHPQYTPEILDILKEHNIKATFFVLGMFAEKYPDIIKRQAKEGHEIGNHTYSHIDVNNVSKKVFEEEFDKTQKIISSLTGVEPKTFRPPYGVYDSKTISITNNLNCSVVLWSPKQDSKDWSNPEINKIISTTLSNIKNGDILLFHDYVYFEKSNTIEALKIIIPELIDRGYSFVTISELKRLSEE